MVEKSIIYFEKCGKVNTEKTLQASKKRADELGIHHIVVATTLGSTAHAAAEIFNDPKYTFTFVNT